MARCRRGTTTASSARARPTSLEGNTRRAIDFHEDEQIDAEALKALVRAAVALNESRARG